MKRLRIAFLCQRGTSFIEPIVRRLAVTHDVSRHYYAHGRADMREVERVLSSVDIAWFEWCDELLAEASHGLERSCKVICRLHSFEAYTDLPRRVRWSFVDRLVFVADHVRRAFEEGVPERERPDMWTVHNGVDLDSFQLSTGVPAKRLAFVAHIDHGKNPSLLLECVRRLVEVDAEYHLHMAGPFVRPVVERSFRHGLKLLGLEKHITLHGLIQDVPSFLEDKRFLVSTSTHEGCPLNVLEGAARGLTPVVYQFEGADALFPKDWLFSTPEQFVDRVLQGRWQPEQRRAVIEARYDQSQQLRQFEALFRDIAGHWGGDAVSPSLAATPLRPDELSNDFKKRGPIAGESVPHLLAGPTRESKQGRPTKDALWLPLPEDVARTLRDGRIDPGFTFEVPQDEGVPNRINFLCSVVEGSRVLDIGAADHVELMGPKRQRGLWLHERLAASASECVGLDREEEAVLMAQQAGLDIRRMSDPGDVSTRDWDYVVLADVLEHVGDPIRLLRDTQAMVGHRPHVLVVTVPNAFRATNFELSRIGKEVINSDHRFWFTPYTLAKVLTDGGYEVTGYRMVQAAGVLLPQTRLMLQTRPLWRDTVAMLACIRRRLTE